MVPKVKKALDLAERFALRENIDEDTRNVVVALADAVADLRNGLTEVARIAITAERIATAAADRIRNPNP